MEHQLQLLRWLMMFLISSTTSKEELVIEDQIKQLDITCSLPHLLCYILSHILKTEHSTETYFLQDGKCMLSEMVFTTTILRKA